MATGNGGTNGGSTKKTSFGDPIFEGDMVMPQELFQRVDGNGNNHSMDGRTAVAEPVLYWPGAVIPYQFHSCKNHIQHSVSCPLTRERERGKVQKMYLKYQKLCDL